MNGKIIGLDIGDARIGVAASDASQVLATPLAIVARKDGNPLDHIIRIIRENICTTVVVGLPLNMDGGKGPQAVKAARFADQLQLAAPDLTILFQDERRSTFEARVKLRDSGASKKKRAEPVDHLAAAVLLQAWLDKQQRQREIKASA